MSLPNGNHTFIAYNRTPEAVRLDDGSTATIRAQVWVSLYEHIKIKDINVGGRSGNEDTVGVTFDAASVGLDNDFSAYLDRDDPTLPRLQEAFEHGAAVQVAIEKKRKRKERTSKEPISPIAPINQLRGATVDGGRADMSASRECVSNVIALVDGQPTGSIVSDENEWALLAENRQGLVVPAGWEVLDDKEWGAPAAIRQSNPTPTPGGFDIAALEGMISRVIGNYVGQEFERLRGDLLDALPNTPRPADGGPEGRRVGRDVFVEGRPWDIRTSDGRLNLGGYLPTRYRYTFSEARDVLLAAGRDSDDASVWKLTEQLLAITDRVQSEAYGSNVAPDRTAPSYSEAAQWVKLSIGDLARNGHGIPADERHEWADMVIATAVSRMGEVRDRATEHLAQRGSAKQRQERQRQQNRPQPETSVPSTHAPAVLKGVADFAQRFQDNAATLSKAARDAQERGQAAVEFAWRAQDDRIEVVVAATLDSSEGWTIQPLFDVLHMLYERAAKAHPETVPANVAPASTPTAAPAGPAASRDAAPTSPKAPRRPTYSPEIGAILRGLVDASTVDEVGAQFVAARDGNHLDEPIAVQAVGEDGTKIGFPGQDGYGRQPLSRVIDRFRRMQERLEAELSATQTEVARSTAAPSDADTATAVAEGDAGQGPVAEAATRDGNADAAAEQEGEVDDAQEAQEAIEDWMQRVAAARASGAIEEIEAVLSEVQGLDLTAAQVQVDGISGPIGGYLAHIIGSMRERALVPSA